MLTYHNIEGLEGKVSKSILNSYIKEYDNLTLASIVAGFHRAYGLRHEGISMAMEIVNSISDDTCNFWDKNLLVWNLYILAKEFICDGAYDKCIEACKRAETNWSRDLLLADEVGVYHVSWKEQLWIRAAEAHMHKGDSVSFEEITDKILMSRLEFFNKAGKATGESIIRDRCFYNCLELMACEKKRVNTEIALSMLKQAVIHKGGSYALKYLNEQDRGGRNIIKNYELMQQLYLHLPESPFDNCGFGYCSTCKHYNENCLCRKHRISTDDKKACTQYEFY